MATATLTARARWGQGLFSDANLDRLSFLLDSSFRVPGTPVRVGLDGLIGLVPVAGDVVAGVASGVIVAAAWFRGVPYVTLARMAVNVALEVGVGAIPVVGDVFDVTWKANRRNYHLLKRSVQAPHRRSWKDYAFLLGLAAVLLMIVAIPVLVMVGLAVWLARMIG